MANRFLNNIRINDSYTLPNADGTENQIIKTDGLGQLGFMNQSDITAGSADKALSLTITVKNRESFALTKGQVVYAAPSLTPPSGNVIEVKLADNDGTDTMPAIGILNEDLEAAGAANDGDQGEAIMFGRISGINTSAFSVGDEVFVSDTPGALTAAKPTGVKYIQKIGVVMRDDASNGTIEVFGAGRTNDVPTPLYIDHANQRLGIGTASPLAPLSFENAVGPKIDFYHTTVGNGDIYGIEVQDSELRIHSGLGGVSAGGITFGKKGTSAFYEAMRITNGGNVGIGTTSPKTGLHLSSGVDNRTVGGTDVSIIRLTNTYGSAFGAGGEIQFGLQDVSGRDVLSLIKGSYTGYDSGNYGGDLEFHTRKPDGLGLQQRMTITNAGYVGIGTTSPNAMLHVSGSQDFVLIESTANSDAAYRSKTTLGYYGSGTGIGSATNCWNVYDFNAGSERMRISSSGNVGIGTTNPGKLLELSGGANVAAIRLRDTTSNVWDIQNSTNGTLDFIRGGTNTYMRINQFGNVSIGTDTTSAKLEVRRDANNGNTGAFTNTHVKLTASATADNTGFVGITAATSTSDNYGYSFGAQRTSGGVGSFKINYHNNSASGTNRFIIDQNGNVGIGAPSPQSKLHVSGSLQNDQFVIPNTAGTSGQVLKWPASGTTLEWSDASGGGSYTPSTISANTNAVKDYLYILTASLTLTLPASPSAGDSIKIANLSGVTTCVIGRNGSNIMATAEDMTLDDNTANFELIYTNATQGWVVIGAN